MKALTYEIKQTLNFIEPEETILLTGEKDSGKATVVEALAKSTDVQKLLQFREDMNAPEAYIIATDCNAIPEDVLIVSTDFSYKMSADFSHDLTLERILCKALLKCRKVCKVYEDAINTVMMDDELRNLFSKDVFRGISYDDSNNFLTILHKFPLEKLLHYCIASGIIRESNVEVFARNLHELFREFDRLGDLRNDFYSLAAKCVNQYIIDITKQLEDKGACIEKTGDNVSTVTAMFDASDYNSSLLKMLLCNYKGKNFSKAFHLFENLSLTFRINENIFLSSVGNKSKDDKFNVRNSNVHSIKFFCTEDLEQKTDDNEISKALATYMDMHGCDKVIMTIDATEAYNSLSKLKEIVNAMPEDSKLYFLFTHFENFILSVSSHSLATNKFNQESTFNWEENRKQAEELFKTFTNNLYYSVSSIKQLCISWYNFVALHTNLSEDLCDNSNPKGCLDYPSAIGYTLDALDHFANIPEEDKLREKLAAHAMSSSIAESMDLF